MILYDSNGGLDAKALQKNLPEGCNAPIVLGELTSDVAGQTDVCVISPGIPLTAPFVEKLREADIPIWSEIELAYRYGAGRIAAITGTNGKTTTTALVGEILAPQIRPGKCGGKHWGSLYLQSFIPDA